MSKSTLKPYVRAIRSGDYLPSVPLAGLSYHVRRMLPWRVLHREECDVLTLLSGDATHLATVWIGKGDAVTANVRHLRADRPGRFLYEGPDGEPLLTATVPKLSGLERGRIGRLFREWPRERLIAAAHDQWSSHSDFCTKDCDYVVPEDFAEYACEDDYYARPHTR